MARSGVASRGPGPAEIQQLSQMLGQGAHARAEALCRQLLKAHPDALVLHNALGMALEGLGRLDDAAASYRRALNLDPNVAEIRFNLAVVLERLGRADEAITGYRKALALRPDLVAAQFNLGALLQARGAAEDAAACYTEAARREPRFLEAHANLGVLLQQQGRLDEAIACYERALALREEPCLYFNLGTALRMRGALGAAEQAYRRALALDPAYADAHNNLGECLRDAGRMDEAVACYRAALAIDATHGAACYNMGETLVLAGKFDEAVGYFDTSTLWDAPDRALHALYRARRFDEFRARLAAGEGARAAHRSPLRATLSLHHAANFGVADEYRFCPRPMDCVYHGHIDELDGESELLAALLRDIEQSEIAARKQGRLYEGEQSAGNLFKRPEASFRQLAEIVRGKFAAYRAQLASEDCEFARAFPCEVEFSSSWFVKMRQGGHLTSHIHEEGWASGVLYLALPSRGAGQEGCLEFSTDGDDYPREHENFPRRVVEQRVGDIVLFPSSLFHRTLPFQADESRICIAFDLKPAPVGE